MLSKAISLIIMCVFFFKCLNCIIPLKCTLANEYPSSDESVKKNGQV